MARWQELGQQLNEGNPWSASKERRDRLRQKLGYWKAMGADNTVLSWIAYGVKLEFASEPEHLTFGNHRSYDMHVDFVDKEHQAHLEDGSFIEVRAEDVLVGNPLQVEQNSKGKLRMCVDLRWPNAYSGPSHLHDGDAEQASRQCRRAR